MFFMGLATSFAQVPLNEQLTYQTVVRNAQNQLVYNQSNVSVTVYVCNLDGTDTRYSETHTGLSTNPNGLLTLMVGGGTPVSGAWNDIIWTDASIYTVITYNPGTGTVTITSDRAPVNAVPYALSAHVDCSDVVDCVDDAIKDPSSTTNIAIDTVIENHLTPYEIKNCGDVTNCVNTAIADGTSTTNHAIDTVIENHLTPYEIKDCGDVNSCVKTEIEDGGSDINHRIDTLVANNIHDSLVNYHIKDCADVMACPDIQRMRDSIQTNHTDIQTVQTELSTLETRVETFNTHVCDSVKDCVAAQIHDSLVAHPVYNSTITFHQEGETDQTITLNQSTDQTINIVTFSQMSQKFDATAAQTDFALTTIPSGKTLDADHHLVQMYVNGVYVGDTVDGVVKITGTTAQYQAGSNGGYTLAQDDRVNFVFWVK